MRAIPGYESFCLSNKVGVLLFSFVFQVFNGNVPQPRFSAQHPQ